MTAALAALAALDQAARAIADARAAIAAQTDATASDHEWPVFADDADLVDTNTAADLACRSPDTIRTWCAERGIGKIYGGRWRISLRRLRMACDPAWGSKPLK